MCQLVNKGSSQVIRRVSVCGRVPSLWTEAITHDGLHLVSPILSYGCITLYTVILRSRKTWISILLWDFSRGDVKNTSVNIRWCTNDRLKKPFHPILAWRTNGLMGIACRKSGECYSQKHGWLKGSYITKWFIRAEIMNHKSCIPGNHP